jgi:t-SNARE complex subunit (syntaxin)
MARNRNTNREKVKQEKALDRKNAYGNLDPTPYEAVERMRRQTAAYKPKATTVSA